MTLLNISHLEKNDIQTFIGNVQATPKELPGFLETFAYGHEASWSRFLRGAYGHPVTWWVGVFQLQMQMGVWGHMRQAIASERASLLWRISEPLRKEIADVGEGKNPAILMAVVRFSLKYRKADMLGRLAGGQFTNYATTGGALGNKALTNAGKAVSIPAKTAVALTNFSIAGYGAAIQTLVKGRSTIEDMVHAVLTGRAEHPVIAPADAAAAPTPEEQAVCVKAGLALTGVMQLTQAAAPPVPLREFCARPENINLKGLCR